MVLTTKVAVLLNFRVRTCLLAEVRETVLEMVMMRAITNPPCLQVSESCLDLNWLSAVDAEYFALRSANVDIV